MSNSPIYDGMQDFINYLKQEVEDIQVYGLYTSTNSLDTFKQTLKVCNDMIKTLPIKSVASI